MTGMAPITARAAILAGRGQRRIALPVDSVDDLFEAASTDARPVDLASLDGLDAEGQIA